MSATNEVQIVNCYACKVPVSLADRYCSKCGAFKPWKKSAPVGWFWRAQHHFGIWLFIGALLYNLKIPGVDGLMFLGIVVVGGLITSTLHYVLDRAS